MFFYTTYNIILIILYILLFKSLKIENTLTNNNNNSFEKILFVKRMILKRSLDDNSKNSDSEDVKRGSEIHEIGYSAASKSFLKTHFKDPLLNINNNIYENKDDGEDVRDVRVSNKTNISTIAIMDSEHVLMHLRDMDWSTILPTNTKITINGAAKAFEYFKNHEITTGKNESEVQSESGEKEFSNSNVTSNLKGLMNRISLHMPEFQVHENMAMPKIDKIIEGIKLKLSNESQTNSTYQRTNQDILDSSFLDDLNQKNDSLISNSKIKSSFYTNITRSNSSEKNLKFLKNNIRSDKSQSFKIILKLMLRRFREKKFFHNLMSLLSNNKDVIRIVSINMENLEKKKISRNFYGPSRPPKIIVEKKNQTIQYVDFTLKTNITYVLENSSICNNNSIKIY